MYRDDLGLDQDGNPTGKGAVAFFVPITLAQIGPAELKQYAARLSKLIRFNPTAGARIIAPANQDEEAV